MWVWHPVNIGNSQPRETFKLPEKAILSGLHQLSCMKYPRRIYVGRSLFLQRSINYVHSQDFDDCVKIQKLNSTSSLKIMRF